MEKGERQGRGVAREEGVRVMVAVARDEPSPLSLNQEGRNIRN